MRSTPPLLLTLLLSACGQELTPEPPQSAADAGAEPADGGAPPAATLEVGTGESDFTALQGQEVALIQAPQAGGGAGAHFWIALRAQGFDPHGVRIQVRIQRVADGFQVSDTTRREDLLEQGGWQLLYGYAAVITQCIDVAGQELEVTAELSDLPGHVAMGRGRLVAPSFCPRPCTDCDPGN